MSKPELFSPTLVDLVATVRDALDHEPTAYERQVGRYLLDMAPRELTQGASLAQRSDRRMDSLLGGEAAPSDRYTRLCASIRSGHYDERLPELLSVLLDEAVDRVSIVRPDVLRGR